MSHPEKCTSRPSSVASLPLMCSMNPALTSDESEFCFTCLASDPWVGETLTQAEQYKRDNYFAACAQCMCLRPSLDIMHIPAPTIAQATPHLLAVSPLANPGQLATVFAYAGATIDDVDIRNRCKTCISTAKATLQG